MSAATITQEVLAAFGRHLRINEKSPHTIEKYLHDAGAFRRFLNGRPLTKGLVMDYKDYLTRSGKYTDGSVNSMLASLRGLFKFLGKEDCNVESIRTQEMPYCPENKSLTMDEYQRLLKAAEGDGRMQMILKVLLGTGIRISELRFFTVEALLGKGRHASIRVSCKKKSREILIPDELKDELLSYIEKRGITAGVIFRTRSGKPLDRSNFWKQLKSLCGKAGVDEDKVFPHNVRKLFARTFYENSHDIAQLACLLGHSSINTTMIYIKRTEREVRTKVEQMLKGALRGSAAREKQGDVRRENHSPGMRGVKKSKGKRRQKRKIKNTPHYPYNVVQDVCR